LREREELQAALAQAKDQAAADVAPARQEGEAALAAFRPEPGAALVAARTDPQEAPSRPSPVPQAHPALSAPPPCRLASSARSPIRRRPKPLASIAVSDTTRRAGEISGTTDTSTPIPKKPMVSQATTADSPAKTKTKTSPPIPNTPHQTNTPARFRRDAFAGPDDGLVVRLAHHKHRP